MLFSTLASAQLNRANRLFEEGEFSQAAQLYERVLERDSTDRMAINNLAHCYRIEKRYRKARELFRETLSFSIGSSTNYYYYAEMHYLLGDYELARKALEKYLENAPGNREAATLLATVNTVQDFPEDTNYAVVSLLGINSPYCDFSPVVHEGGIVFTSERTSRKQKGKMSMADHPFTNIFYAPFKDEERTSFTEPTEVSNKLNSRYHDGPVCFNKVGDVVYFSRVNREFSRKDKLNTVKIFTAEKDGESWSKPEMLPISSSDYSVAHPALSEDGRTLYFSSNMPGGYGGMDLYLSRLTDGKWSVPVNLGEGVNTDGDEVFPHVRHQRLYFSSDGWPGYGGLDLFSAHLDSLQNTPQNLYAPINSAWDDISIAYLSENQAFFSSDRPGGQGRDDIYAVQRKTSQSTHRLLTGVLEHNKKAAPHASLLLKDSGGKVLQRATTNEEGQFSFDYLESKVSYVISLDADLKTDMSNFAIFLLNNKKERVQKISPNPSGDFKFELLPPDDFDTLELLPEEDTSLLSLDIHGKVFADEPGDFSDKIEVLVFNAKGEIVGRTITRKYGNFLFNNLFPDDQYIFRLLSENPGLKIAIYDEQGNHIETITTTGKDFVYNRFKEGDRVLSLINENNLTIRISPDDRFEIPNIYYALDDHTLNAAAKLEINKLVDILMKNPSVDVRVMSHTDSRASDEYNLQLSERRARGVVSYLIAEGIAQSRISGKGYGETKLVNHCTSGVSCTEEEHAKNRRTEFGLSEK